MKIKNFVSIATLFFVVTSCSLAQLTNLPTKPWSATIKVVGENELPANAVDIAVAYTKPPYSFSDNPIYHGIISGITDSNGIFSATHDDRSGSLGFSVNKQGYYTTRSACRLSDPEESANDRNISITLLLKKIGQPTAMYAKLVNLGVPDFDKPLGFDLMIGDWVAPNGTGINTDIIFTGHLDKRAKNDSDYKLIVSFPNAGDGIQEFVVQESAKGSELRSPHETPLNGYQPEWTQTKTRRPGKPLQTNWNMSRNYFFRVRTKLDDKGNVVSAHYGKIYGDFMNFTYYLNPTPNSRNIEFDPKQNLIKSLKSDEGVQAP